MQRVCSTLGPRDFCAPTQRLQAHKETLSAPSEITIGRYSWAVIPLHGANAAPLKEKTPMAWTTPTLVEICIGLEINGYLPAEF
jgi:coenzyme PQQ precursor peptide PqqA